jgi:hypothetical protein
MNYLEFHQKLAGYTFHSKRTGRQVYRFEMYFAKLTPEQCFEKFNTKIIIKNSML